MAHDSRTTFCRVTWRLELPAGWGGRLDPEWLPRGGTESWRQVFAGEDRAGAVFAAGGGGLRWSQLAAVGHGLADTLEQYRLQWRVAEETATGCPVAAAEHLAALAVDDSLQPPQRSLPEGPWRLCGLVDGHPATLARFASVDLAEGAAVAHRTGAAHCVSWAEPEAAGPPPPDAPHGGWSPRVDSTLRLTAFAVEDAVAQLCAAAATGHTGPDVLDTGLLCMLGVAIHRMILEYRTLFRAAWTELEACRRSAEHDAEAEGRLAVVPGPVPGGAWRHVLLAARSVHEVSVHDGRVAAGASVAAARAVDDSGVRWAEPVAVADRDV